MRAIPTVLHTGDMEPITVVDIPAEAVRMLHGGGEVRFLMPGPESRALPNGRLTPEEVESVVASGCPMVVIHADKLGSDDGTCAWVYISDDSALTIPPGFLPGQREQVRQLEELAYRRGLYDGRAGK
jgi:hypothetical protein